MLKNIIMDAPFMERLEKYMTGETEIKAVLGNIEGKNENTDIEISMLFIDEKERKKGKAKKAIKEIIELSKGYGFERIWIKAQRIYHKGKFSEVSREKLVEIYEKFGFEVQYESYPSIVMKMELK